jgi:membrane protein CcdC involved in cytochrome C biogenesis
MSSYYILLGLFVMSIFCCFLISTQKWEDLGYSGLFFIVGFCAGLCPI